MSVWVLFLVAILPLSQLTTAQRTYLTANALLPKAENNAVHCFIFCANIYFLLESDKSLQQWCWGILVTPPLRSFYADTRTPTPGTE